MPENSNMPRGEQKHDNEQVSVNEGNHSPAYTSDDTHDATTHTNGGTNDAQVTENAGQGGTEIPGSPHQTVDQEQIHLTPIPPVLSEDDFKALNYELFSFSPPTNQIMDSSRIVVVVVAGQEVLVHARILINSRFLYETFHNGSIDDISDSVTLPGVELQELKLVMTALYGINSPILGHEAYTGADYIRALSLSNALGCEPFVYKSLSDCARGYFHGFKDWKSIPFNGLTHDLHRKLIMDINEAYKAYRNRGPGPHAFFEHSFGIMMLEFCPRQVYAVYDEQLDEEFVHLVAGVSYRKSFLDYPFEADETLLFTRPDY